MKVIIAGSRTITDMRFIEAAIRESGFNITEVVSGAANGVDKLGARWAVRRGIPVKQFRAAWNIYGFKEAGPIRNEQMARYADALIAIWDGKSKGTAHMIWIAKKLKIPLYIYNVGRPGKIYALPDATTGDYS